MKKMGPNETTVRATLPPAPASILYLDGESGDRSTDALRLFNGARQGHVTPNGGLFSARLNANVIGKKFGPPYRPLRNLHRVSVGGSPVNL